MQAMPMIAVRDVRASAAFYETLLGAKSGHGGDEYEQLLVNGRLVLQLHDVHPDPQHGPLRDLSLPNGNGLALWFETEDFDALLARVQQHSIALMRKPAVNPYSGKRELWLHDPDGYLVVLADAKGQKPRHGEA